MVRQHFALFFKHWEEITGKKLRDVQINRYAMNHIWMLDRNGVIFSKQISKLYILPLLSMTIF